MNANFRILSSLAWHSAALIVWAAGVVLVAAVLLLPAYQENREVAWQRDLLRLQADRLGEQNDGYHETVAALEGEDPVLLERLAYTYLHLKPKGTILLEDMDQGIAQADTMQTVEQWLQRPMPEVGVDFASLDPMPRPLQTAHRLVTGPTRHMVLLLGIVLVALGIMLPVKNAAPASQEQQDRKAEKQEMAEAPAAA